MKVLILDDYENLRNMLKEHFEHIIGNGAEVYTAKNYTEAIELCTAIIFDVTFVDIDLCDKKNGLDFVEWLNSRQPDAENVIYTSGSITPELSQRISNLKYKILCDKRMTLDKAREILIRKKVESGTYSEDESEHDIFKDKFYVLEMRFIELHKDTQKAVSDTNTQGEYIEKLFDKVDEISANALPKMAIDLREYVQKRSNYATIASLIMGVVIFLTNLIAIKMKSGA